MAGWLEFHPLEEDFPRQRIAVRVQSARGNADDGVAGRDGLAVEHPRFFHDTHNRPAYVVFARLIKARQLRGLAADQRAAVLRAGLREALDDLGEHARLEFAGSEI